MSEVTKQSKRSILINGLASSGKTTSLDGILNKQRWGYLSCDAGKPFNYEYLVDNTEFIEKKVIVATKVPDYITQIDKSPKFDGVIIDTLSMLLNSWISQNLIGARDTQQQWLMYSEWVKNMFNQTVASCEVSTIFTSHTMETRDELGEVVSVQAAVQGKMLAALSIEAFFNTVIFCKRVSIPKIEKDLAEFGATQDEDGNWNSMLTITPLERAIGFKNVFQMHPTATTIHERIRTPRGMFKPSELYIDNNVQLVLDRMNEVEAKRNN